MVEIKKLTKKYEKKLTLYENAGAIMSILKAFKEKRGENPFLILISFLISFIIARTYVLILGSKGSAGNLFPLENYILHHLYYGIGLLIIAGWISINYKNKDLNRLSAILYGSGLGIFFDEIGLILTEFGNYWDSITYTTVIIISLLLLNIIFFSTFWQNVSTDLQKFAKKHDLKHGPVSLIGLINILGKLDNNIPATNKITTIFIGIIFIGSGILTLRFPALMYYWIASAFFLTGLSYIIKGIKG